MRRIVGIAIGTVMGAAMGVATDNVAGGIGVGLAIGIALAMAAGGGTKQRQTHSGKVCGAFPPASASDPGGAGGRLFPADAARVRMAMARRSIPR
jgi:hypothetical protein